MLFQNEEESLQLQVVSYEFPPEGGLPGSDDRNWLVLRATWVNDEGRILKDSNSCLLAGELQELTAGLKVLKAGLKARYESVFREPYFLLSAQAEGEVYRIYVSFTLPNTMEDEDVAELYVTMTAEELQALIDELDELCRKFPERVS